MCEKTKKKEKKKTQKFVHSYLRNALCSFLQIWCVVYLGKGTPPQQHWNQSDKRSRSYECVKIVSLLFPLIYSHSLRTSHFLGQHDTLPCVLITIFTCSLQEFCFSQVIMLENVTLYYYFAKQNTRNFDHLIAFWSWGHQDDSLRTGIEMDTNAIAFRKLVISVFKR